MLFSFGAVLNLFIKKAPQYAWVPPLFIYNAASLINNRTCPVSVGASFAPVDQSEECLNAHRSRLCRGVPSTFRSTCNHLAILFVSSSSCDRWIPAQGHPLSLPARLQSSKYAHLFPPSIQSRQGHTVLPAPDKQPMLLLTYFSTSSTVTILKSPNIECFKHEDGNSKIEGFLKVATVRAQTIDQTTAKTSPPPTRSTISVISKEGPT